MTTALPGAWDTHIHVFSGVARQGSHYSPPECTLQMWRAAAEPLGFAHAVLIQPSIYGTDNSVMLTALQASKGAHRAVAVVDADISDRELAAMHDLGVRGVRVNLVSPVGYRPANIPRLASRVKELGWHMQYYTTQGDLPLVAAQQRETSHVVVLDHFAGVSANSSLTGDERHALERLADRGAWIKCSALYRLGAARPYEAVTPMITDALARFSGRVLWGSDWPHTWFLESQHSRDRVPNFVDLLGPFAEAFTDPRVKQDLLVHAPQRLYL